MTIFSDRIKLLALCCIIFTSCDTTLHRGYRNSGSYAAECQQTYGWSDDVRFSTNVMNDRNTEEYDPIKENDFKSALSEPLSTFSIDVDNASYSNVRRFIQNGQWPSSGSVRTEELINYFDYAYDEPTGDDPFTLSTQLAACPWNKNNKLLKVGLKGKPMDLENIKSSNLVFLIDVSGSMSGKNKLPLLKNSFKILTENLPAGSRVSIVTYAGDAGLVLPSTDVSEKKEIDKAIDRLQPLGGTAGKAGIEKAYEIASANLIEGGNNRVILATDGDFNVGVSSTSDLVDLIQEKKKEDIYLTICGFGMGNYKDGRMEQISNAGNGNYFYIDGVSEALKVFDKELMANMFTIAKDVKMQIEFNPNTVNAYRLIGYENRVLASDDFNDDKVDAGELGAGHTVTALYEIVPQGIRPAEVRKTDDLTFQKRMVGSDGESLALLKLRYKPIGSEESILIEQQVLDSDRDWTKMDSEFNLAASVAGWGMYLTDSKYKGDLDMSLLKAMAKKSLENDVNGYRAEYLSLISKSEELHQ